MACCVLLITHPSFRTICCEYFSRRTVPPNYAMRSSRSNEKSVFRIAGYPHSRLVKLARLAKGRVAFNGGKDKLIIRNLTSTKISTVCSYLGEKDAGIATSSRHAADYYPQSRRYKNPRVPYGNTK